jgi:hypothetical protein
MLKPQLVLSLDPARKIKRGSTKLLNKKLAAGADLRISTGFLHNEHIDITSDDNQLIAETSTFAETVIIDGKWSAYFMTARQPVGLREGFGYPNSLSLFLYNQDGLQGVARLIMDGTLDKSARRDSEHGGFPKVRTFNIQDEKTAGISKTFIYDFEFYDYIVSDCYREIFANSKEGKPRLGSIDALAKAYRAGRGIKLAVRGLSQVLWGDTGHEDEIFIHCGSSYYYTSDKLMFTNTLPFVSVPADIPLTYKPKGFRYCWIVARSDGRVAVRSYNVFKNTWETRQARLALRWFAQV